VVADQVGNDLLRQEIEHLRVPEEAGDVDQQVPGQEVELAGIASQDLEIPARVGGPGRRHRHAPLDPALQRPRLVQREIMGGPGPQKLDDLGQPDLRSILRCRTVRPTNARHPSVVSRERVGNLGQGKH
jgi:hypothetical protein